MPISNDVQIILARLRRSTGRQYPSLEKELEMLSLPALMDLGRLLVDLEQEKNLAVNRVRITPFRR